MPTGGQSHGADKIVLQDKIKSVNAVLPIPIVDNCVENNVAINQVVNLDSAVPIFSVDKNAGSLDNADQVLNSDSAVLSIPVDKIAENIVVVNQVTNCINSELIPGIANEYVPAVSPLTKCLSNWKVFLKNDIDSDYILQGIEFGFRIINPGIVPESTLCRNYKSASVENKESSELQVQIRDENSPLLSGKPLFLELLDHS